MSTVAGQDETGTDGRRFTSLVQITQSENGSFAAGQIERVQDGREANALLAKAEQAGSRFLVAISPQANGSTGTGSTGTDPTGNSPSGTRPTELAISAMVALQRSSGDHLIGSMADDAELLGLAVVESDASQATTVPPLVVGVTAMAQVGGFDPDEPGLGWIDLADRLARGGFALAGFDHQALPFVAALTSSLTPADRMDQEGRWLRKRADGPVSRMRLEYHRRRVLAAAARADGMDQAESAARRRWRGKRPDQAQRGTGRRADWRHLIAPPSSGGSAVALVGLGPVEAWQWLVDDGWARSVTTNLPSITDLAVTDSAVTNPTTGDSALDVVVVGASALQAAPEVLERAEASVSEFGSVVVMVEPMRRPRRRAGHRPVVKALSRSGAFETRRYLALPDVEAPKRYIPLDHPGGLAWLAGPAPALAQARLDRSRRLLRQMIRRLAPRVPELLGGVVVVASASLRQETKLSNETGPSGAEPETSIVITSGFDEGSRTVVLPLGTHGRPDRVVKITARPAYRDNAEREHRLLTELSARVQPAGLVPTPLDRIDDGETHAVVESYAGRWTVADVLNEQRRLEARSAMLDVALDAVSKLARTGLETETWSEDGFDELIGRWFDRIDQLHGSSPLLAALRQSLAERSRQLEGLALPIGVRHFDIGPWNMVVADEVTPDGATAERSPITVVDWELAPPRSVPAGPVGADHLYFTKYWLHIAADCRSIEAEQSAFAFLAGTMGPGSRTAAQSVNEAARAAAKDALSRSLAHLEVPTGFLPILEAHVWAEAACYTSERRRARGGDGGSPARYLETVARHRSALLDSWPL